MGVARLWMGALRARHGVEGEEPDATSEFWTDYKSQSVD